MSTTLCWVVLTMGDRPEALAAAIGSIRRQDVGGEIVVVLNGAPATAVDLPGVRLVLSADNLGIPGGRDLGVQATDASIVAFLDDDAVLLTTDAAARIVQEFERTAHLGAVTMRLVDETGTTARRHIPRAGERGADVGGDVVVFLGGASAIRRTAYDAAGGLWPALFYAHEELDLAWRLHDAGWSVRYVPDIVVEHPRTPISRHRDGWRRTGRNRVMIARRDLPWPVAVVHVIAWLLLGTVRAPDAACRRAYLGSWWAGWREPVPRRPIRYATVWRLARLGRPPVI